MVISVPSPGAQRRIAEVLDTVDEAIRSTERLITKLEQAMRGLLYDVLTTGIDRSGRLRQPSRHPHRFRDSRRGRIPTAWSVVNLGDLVDPTRPIVYGILMPGKHVDNGVPVIKVKDIRDGAIDEGELLRTSRRIDEEYRRSRVIPGDLLFTIRGTVGRMAFVPPQLAGANITQDTARIAIVRASRRFVRYYLGMPPAIAFIDLYTLGQAVRGINLRDVRRIPIALPPREEQDVLVEQLDAIQDRIRIERKHLLALRVLKHGLMDDLLTGRVRLQAREGSPV